MRLLRLTREDVRRYRDQVRHGDRGAKPDAVRASAGINATEQDVTRLLRAVARIADGSQPPIQYRQDPRTGDYHPCGDIPGQLPQSSAHQAPCSSG
jgi:hypothetical protein